MKKLTKLLVIIYTFGIVFSALNASEVTIGAGDQLARKPVDMYWKNSLQEMLYYQTELNIVGVGITGVTFYNNFVTNLPAKPVKIWLGTSTVTDLSAGWIPSTDLTLVFDGVVYFPSGANIINITFATPFNYNGDNLVMMVNRLMDTEYFSSSDNFLCQTIGTNRTLAIQGDTTIYDPADPPTGGTLSGQFPKTTFLYGPTITNDLACVSVTGNITPMAYTLCNYVVTVTNNGTAIQDTYTVKLFTQDDLEIGSVPGTTIAPTQSLTYNIQWTPTIAGATFLYGKVIFDDDEFPQNNQSISLNIDVLIAEILAPNGGENWLINTLSTVYWHFTGADSQVNILLSVDNGANWIMMNTSPVLTSLGRYTFTVPSLSSSQCLIKVISTTNSNWFDISDAPFTITSIPTECLFLTSPTNAKLQTGKSYAINWLATGVSTVNLEYSFDAGVSWNSIAASLPANPGTYSWTVPNTPSALCYIKISDTNDYTVYDWNDVPFTISSLQLLTPNGGDLFRFGSTRSITWISEQIANVKLEYSSNSGTSWTQIVASAPTTNGSYNWTVSSPASDQCLIRISDVEDNTINDASDNVFTVAALVVSYPNSTSLKFQVGKECNITWTQLFLPGTVKLELTTNSGTTYTTIATGVLASIGTYLWAIPDSPSTTCKIRITSEVDMLVLDSSDNNFTISKLCLNSPNGYETWGSASVNAITWTSANVTNLKLEYSIDNAINWVQIVASVAASSGTYNWTVPTANSNLCRVRITDTTSAVVYDTSDVTFTIRPQIIVTAPNGNECLSIGSIYSIFWNTMAEVSFVLIDYSINGGISWLPIQASSYPASVGRYDWVVPNNPSVNCLVKVRSFANSAVYDVSDAVFTIELANPEIALSPNTVLDFGITLPGTQSTKNLWVKNIGTAILTISSIDFMLVNSPYDILGLSLPINIAVGDSTAILVSYTPIESGVTTDSLYIHNNSVNMPVAVIMLSGNDLFIPPSPPQNLSIIMQGIGNCDAFLSWDAVTTDIYGNLITPDYYLVFFNGSSDPDGMLYFLASVSGLTYTHYTVGLHSPYMFYRVRAYKYYGRGEVDIASLGLLQGMTEDEVLWRLNGMR